MRRLFNTPEALLFLLSVLPLGLYAALAGRLPAQVPSHWNFTGQVDGTAAPWLLALMPLALYLLLTGLLLISPPKVDVTARVVYRIRVLLQLLLLFLVGLSYSVGLGLPLAADRAIALSMLLFFAFMGNLMLNVPRNDIIGIRTPWTLNSDLVWQKTHRWAAYAWVAGGALGAVVVLALPGWLQTSVALGMILVLALAPIPYSYWLHRRLSAGG